MSKINRNDPCPCGSGKKYKKCCGAKTEVPIQVNYEEARQFQNDLLDYTAQKYDREILAIAQKQEIYPALDEEAKDLYAFNLRLWSMLSQPMADGKTILEEYLEDQEEVLVRTKTREIVLSWKNTAPAVLFVKEETDAFLKLEDIVTKKEHRLPLEGYRDQDMDPGSLVLGYPVDLGDTVSFFAPFVSIELKHTDRILKDMEKLTAAYAKAGNDLSRLMAEQFPQVLNILFEAVYQYEEADTDAASEYVWANSKEEETAQLLRDGLSAESYPEQLAEEAVKLWHSFCTKDKPSIRKPEAFAAAVEYAVKELSSGEYGLSQGRLAEKYGVGASTISKRFKEIEAAMFAPAN